MKTAIVLGLVSAVALQAQEKVDFSKVIKPILESRCMECHNPEKEKGDLLLHTKEAALEHVIVPGKADESELFKRVSLPADHVDIMPPKGDPLTKEQIEALKKWIDEGASWPDGLVLSGGAAAPVAEGQKPAAGGEFSGLTETKDVEAEKKALEELSKLGVSVRPIAQNLQWKETTVRPQDAAKTGEIIALLKNVPSLVELNLAGQKVTDKDLENLAPLSNLMRLHLEGTEITDAGLAHLKGLTNLRYLNLYNTQVSDAGLEHLKGLKNLKNLYLWQTKVTDEGAKNLFAALPQSTINRGAELVLVAKAEAKKPADNQAAGEKNPEQLNNNEVEVNLEKASLAQALDLYRTLVAGQLLLDPRVATSSQTITVKGEKKLSRTEAAELLEKALREQGGIEFNRTVTATIKKPAQ